MRDPSQLEQLETYIRAVGVAAVARKSKVSERALAYFLAGTYKPSYRTLQKLLKAAGLA